MRRTLCCQVRTQPNTQQNFLVINNNRHYKPEARNRNLAVTQAEVRTIKDYNYHQHYYPLFTTTWLVYDKFTYSTHRYRTASSINKTLPIPHYCYAPPPPLPLQYTITTIYTTTTNGLLLNTILFTNWVFITYFSSHYS